MKFTPKKNNGKTTNTVHGNKPTLNKIHRDSQSNTLSVSKFTQYYFSCSPRCANLSTARTFVRAKRSNFSN